MSRYAAMFARERGVFGAFVMLGDPDLATSAALLDELVAGGADMLEVGIPFSDPIADGPVIQAGSERALKAGTTMIKVLEIACEIRKRSQIPLLLFTYLNPALHYGLEKLGRDAKAAGIDGCLLTDLSVEEAAPYVKVMREAGLDTVFLAAPTSTPERLKLVAEYSTGFVYLVSRTGVTGERASLSDSLAPLILSMRTVTSLPLAAGFGIATPEQAGAVAKMADGVVVGSALVRLIGNNASDQQVEEFARALRKGMEA